LVVLHHLVEDGQGQLAVRGAGPPVALRLRKDGDERERLLRLADRQGEAALDGLLAVGAPGAGAVQEQDRRERLLAVVGARDEDDIFRLLTAGARVDAVDEPRSRRVRRQAETTEHDGQPRHLPALRYFFCAAATSASTARFSSSGSGAPI